MKKPIKLPKFKNEAEESEFWANLDLSKHFEKKDFKNVIFPNLKPTSRSISIRIPEHILFSLKEKANKTNVPYQSLIKSYIEQGLSRNR